MPFEDDEADAGVLGRDSGIKLNNADSVIKPKEDPKKKFEDRANTLHSKDEQFKKLAVEVGSLFIRVLEDRTLAENKGEIGKNIEKEALIKLIQLGIDMNIDESQDEGMGSMGVITLLIRGLLSQRDRINSLEYKVIKLTNAFNTFASNSSRVADNDPQSSTEK